jgi:hypothetical protein
MLERTMNRPTPKRHIGSLVVIASSLLFSGTGVAQLLNEAQKLVVVDPKSDSEFGYSIAIDAATALVGATGDDGGNDVLRQSGSVYVFGRTAGVWTERAKLRSPHPYPEEGFGASVALDADVAVIGATTAFPDWFGSAYVFKRSKGVWTQEAQLGSPIPQFRAFFGHSVAIDPDRVVIGVPFEDDEGTVPESSEDVDKGAAYVFRRIGGRWTQEARLTSLDPAPGEAYHFGESVAIDGHTIAIGAPIGPPPRHGSVRVFTRVAGVWTEQAELRASDAAPSDYFGSSVALSGDTIVVGAPGRGAQGAGTGAAYVYKRIGTVWTQQAKLVMANGVAGDGFGSKVALDGDAAVISSNHAAGTAYVFSRTCTTWTQRAELTPSDAPSGDFGRSIALDGSTVMVGARWDDDNGRNSGSAYVFPLFSLRLDDEHGRRRRVHWPCELHQPDHPFPPQHLDWHKHHRHMEHERHIERNRHK